jgi:large repetitive protein
VVARATDSAGNVANSSTASFTYNTSRPNVAVSFPTTGTTYNSGTWSGSITGTASSTAGSGTSVTSSAVSIEDTNTSKYWNGSGFSSSTQVFNTASGTPTSWNYALPASNLTSGDSYTVVGQATDSAGNTGTSSTVTFTYNSVPTVFGQGATNSNTVPNVTSTPGATDLIVAYCEGSPNCSSQTATVATGSGTPFSSASAATISPIVNSGNTKDCLEIIQAVGNGNTGTVTVSDASNGNAVWGDVLQLSSGETVHGTPQINGGTGTTATASLTTPSLSEIALVAMNDTTGTATITAPSGMTELGSYQHTDGSIDADLGMYYNPTAQASAAFTLSASHLWATIAAIVG